MIPRRGGQPSTGRVRASDGSRRSWTPTVAARMKPSSSSDDQPLMDRAESSRRPAQREVEQESRAQQQRSDQRACTECQCNLPGGHPCLLSEARSGQLRPGPDEADRRKDDRQRQQGRPDGARVERLADQLRDQSAADQPASVRDDARVLEFRSPEGWQQEGTHAEDQQTGQPERLDLAVRLHERQVASGRPAERWYPERVQPDPEAADETQTERHSRRRPVDIRERRGLHKSHHTPRASMIASASMISAGIASGRPTTDVHLRSRRAPTRSSSGARLAGHSCSVNDVDLPLHAGLLVAGDGADVLVVALRGRGEFQAGRLARLRQRLQRRARLVGLDGREGDVVLDGALVLQDDLDRLANLRLDVGGANFRSVATTLTSVTAWAAGAVWAWVWIDGAATAGPGRSSSADVGPVSASW